MENIEDSINLKLVSIAAKTTQQHISTSVCMLDLPPQKGWTNNNSELVNRVSKLWNHSQTSIYIHTDSKPYR